MNVRYNEKGNFDDRSDEEEVGPVKIAVGNTQAADLRADRVEYL